MKQEEFMKTIFDEMYLLNKGVRPAAYIYPVTKVNIKQLKDYIKSKEELGVEKFQYRVFDEDSNKLWLFKHDSVGVLLDELFNISFEARQMLMGYLLGYSPTQEDIWLEKIREDGEGYA